MESFFVQCGKVALVKICRYESDKVLSIEGYVINIRRDETEPLIFVFKK